MKHPTLFQVMISRFMSSSPALGSVLTVQSLEPASDSVSPFLSAPPLLTLCCSLSKNKQTLKKNFFNIDFRGIWVSQSVEQPTSAQVMISQSVSSSPTSDSVLTARSLQPASYSVSPSLSGPPLFMLCLSLSQK